MRLLKIRFLGTQTATYQLLTQVKVLPKTPFKAKCSLIKSKYVLKLAFDNHIS